MKRTAKATSAAAEAELADITYACERRDKRALYAAMAKVVRRIKPDEPVDIARVRVCARVYAGDIHGWEIDA